MTRRERVSGLMRAGQARLVAAFEALDGGSFGTHVWERPGGGGGTARILEGGRVFERAGVNVSAVHGAAVPPSLARQHPGTEGRPFFATGISLVLHPQNPYVPAFHANYRYFEIGGEIGGEMSEPSSELEQARQAAQNPEMLPPAPAQEMLPPAPVQEPPPPIFWFGGGADMTPNYPCEDDVRHLHRTLRAQCVRHGVDYQALKATCDAYFHIKHRREMRGVGGIFFDELEPPGGADFERGFAFAEDGIATILETYLPIVERRKDAPFGEREREWQLYRRGRYAEFNLVYDRGTLFGLQTGGNIEAILMSMPPQARWSFERAPEPGSPEARMLELLQPRDWA